MTYVPHTGRDREEMLRAVGAKDVEDLLKEIPASIRHGGDLPLPPPLSQKEVEEEIDSFARENRAAAECDSFLGGGVYDHYIPPLVGAVLSDPGFYTAYTPYQAEVSQGTLQAIFEFQSSLSRLTGMPIANASLYDGATSLVEGVWMGAAAMKGKSELLVSRSVHPRYRAVLRSHLSVSGLRIREIPYGAAGATDLAAMEEAISPDTAMVVTQSPNYFGRLEETVETGTIAHEKGILFLQVFDPVSLAIVRTPGEAGADIAVGEGQPLGVPPSYGGPLLGLFTATDRFLRKMPGRLVGLTEDSAGARAFTLTLQTREQHIRREKATSNICTNQGLVALAATVHLAALGSEGIRRAALHSQKGALELRSELERAGAEFPVPGPFFREFVVRFPERAIRLGLIPHLMKEGIVPGIPLETDYPELENSFLVATTERRSSAAIRRYGKTVSAFLAGIREEAGHE